MSDNPALRTCVSCRATNVRVAEVMPATARWLVPAGDGTARFQEVVVRLCGDCLRAGLRNLEDHRVPEGAVTP